jgi:hypothetical protein
VVYPNLQQGRKSGLIPAATNRLARLELSARINRARTSTLWRDWASVGGLAVAALVNVAIYLYIWGNLDRLPPLLPLHYNGAGEVDLIGRPFELFRMPAIGTVVLFFNLAIGSYLHPTDTLATRLLVAAALLVQVLLFGAAIGIIARAFG